MYRSAFGASIPDFILGNLVALDISSSGNPDALLGLDVVDTRGRDISSSGNPVGLLASFLADGFAEELGVVGGGTIIPEVSGSIREGGPLARLPTENEFLRNFDKSPEALFAPRTTEPTP